MHGKKKKSETLAFARSGRSHAQDSVHSIPAQISIAGTSSAWPASRISSRGDRKRERGLGHTLHVAATSPWVAK
jgi:hypothetical protein